MFTFEYDGQTWHNHPVSDHYGVYCETERVDDPEEESADESNIIDLPGKTVTGSSDPSKEELLDLIGLSERDSLMSGASASSNMECAEGHSVSSVLGTEGTAQVVSSSGNVYWADHGRLWARSVRSARSRIPREMIRRQCPKMWNF